PALLSARVSHVHDLARFVFPHLDGATRARRRRVSLDRKEKHGPSRGGLVVPRSLMFEGMRKNLILAVEDAQVAEIRVPDRAVDRLRQGDPEHGSGGRGLDLE